jgi:protein transport protein SEC31
MARYWQSKHSATVAWSPLNSDRGLLAVGTVANAIDDSFETTADLEILQVDFSSGSPKEMPTKGKVKCSERFHRLAWGGQGHGPMSMGMVAGGMIDGSIGFWSAGILTGAAEGEALVARVQKHKGPVRGLDFNQFKPNLLASGATESEILIWDLTNPQTPNVPPPAQPIPTRAEPVLF